MSSQPVDTAWPTPTTSAENSKQWVEQDLWPHTEPHLALPKEEIEKSAGYAWDASTKTHLSGPELTPRPGFLLKNKLRLSKEEVKKLESVFRDNPKPSLSVKVQLAESLGIEAARVNNWFQNRRAKSKQERKQLEYEASKAAEKLDSESSSSEETSGGHRLQVHGNEKSVAQRHPKEPPSTARYAAPSTEYEGEEAIPLRRPGQTGILVWLLDYLRNNRISGMGEAIITVVLQSFIYLRMLVSISIHGRFWSRAAVMLRNMLSDYMQPRVVAGYVRISWTCRCGKRLHIEVPNDRREAGIAFAQQASGPANVDSVSYTASDADDASSTSSGTNSSTANGSFQDSSLSLGSPSTAPSMSSDSLPDPFIPAGTRYYMLLCVNTGIRRITLANVDVTDVGDDEGVFKKLQMEYARLRGQRKRNPLIRPKTMHYIKFQLVHLRKSGECVGSYEPNSIPSRTEIDNYEYAFSPCPPALGDLPIPPALFMHAFLDPGDHMGSMALGMLPKKLREELHWDSSINDSSNFPVGWGFYITEGFDWPRVTWFVIVSVLAVTLLTISWAALMRDVQGGTGIGQYCIALVAVIISAACLPSEVFHGLA